MSSTVTEITQHQQYHSVGLEEQDLEGAEPLELFKRSFEDAQRSRLVAEPEVMCLLTAILAGEVSSRFVLLKKIKPTTGLVFFTNYNSQKAQEICQKPHESQRYFDAWPLGSHIGVWASPQSSLLKTRSQLLDLVAKHDSRFDVQPGSINHHPPSQQDLNTHIPCPIIGAASESSLTRSSSGSAVTAS
ncbi:uncharacterized protein PGTG_13092 [Puccinia graminis f. sp. tritici CRL 75-36-700-3]|uniref:pyridoxal 5'-phosphate synthase n=1 Tax=Puccinia graminis f. sp. tritici (strain CRL 75-36-700-3 / race SCCL) TaxID=418459 RepID=E3KQY5_PUCGT|nr:uncharacterized protein PGTG_13092 [Puccinia graminis f. sp. tritici CRL 75-36-700-3]EFP86710.1 hypothetical protein PGTG_13092 [Puccinia graminis f. sp. tritici CRL 75-36-700-3]